MEVVLLVIHLILALSLIGLVLIQRSEGGALGIGGGGGGQEAGRQESGDGTFSELRDYGLGAQILLDLGVTEMIVLSNTKRTVVGLEGYGLKIVGQQPIESGEG